MKDIKVLANASALVTLVVYFVCVLITWVAPGLLLSYTSLIFHGITLEPLQNAQPLDITNIIIGSLLSAASVWVIVYATAYTYNKLKK